MPIISILNQSKHADIQDTWGHLRPAPKQYYGTITMYHTEYRISGVFSYDITGIHDSPWWYEALTEFSESEVVKKFLPEGSIIKFYVRVWCKKDGTFTVRPTKFVECDLT